MSDPRPPVARELARELEQDPGVTANDLLLLVGMLDEIDRDLSEGRIGNARTRLADVASAVLRHARSARERESYAARQATDRLAGLLESVTTREGLQAVLSPLRAAHQGHARLDPACPFCNGALT